MRKCYNGRQYEDSQVLRACASNERVHFKPTYETCRAIRRMKVDQAIKYLEAVIRKERAVPFRRYNEGVAHHAQGHEWGCPSARWPVKSAQLLLRLIKSACASAKNANKNVDVDKAIVYDAQCNRARHLRWRRIHQAHGRVKSYASPPTCVQLIIAEPLQKHGSA